MNALAKQKCIPCEGGAKPLQGAEITKLKSQIPNWVVAEDNKKLSREFRFRTFMDAMEFVSQVADIAEGEDHHPNIHIFYNRVRLDLVTHAIEGLSENDFIVAAKINALPNVAT